MFDDKFRDELDSFSKETEGEYQQIKSNDLPALRQKLTEIRKTIPREEWESIIFSEKYRVDDEAEWISLVGLPIADRETFFKMQRFLDQQELKYKFVPNLNETYPYVEFKFLPSKYRIGSKYIDPDFIFDVRVATVKWEGHGSRRVLLLNYAPAPIVAEYEQNN